MSASIVFLLLGLACLAVVVAGVVALVASFVRDLGDWVRARRLRRAVQDDIATLVADLEQLPATIHPIEFARARRRRMGGAA